MNLLDAFKQYIRDAMPGGALNPEVTTQGVLDAAALGTAPVPIVGDAIGLAADVRRLAKNPEERTPMNYGLAALGALPFVPGGLAGMFVGKGAKTWDAISAAKAKELANKGVDQRQIWKETGTFKGPDGHWRQEIDDSVAKLRDYQFAPKEALKESYWTLAEQPNKLERIEAMKPYAGMSKNQLKAEYKRTGGEIVDAAIAGDMAKAKELEAGRSGLNDLLSTMSQRRYGPASTYMSHGELGAAYPDVYKMHTRIDGNIGAKGQYSQASTGVGEQMVLAKKPMWDEDKSTLLHEMQHAIQNREGWARGGNPSSNGGVGLDKVSSMDWAKKAYEASHQSSGDPLLAELFDGAKPWSALSDREKLGWLDQGRNDAYRHLAGEAEARATQARMNMNAAQRREVFPLDSYDVPLEELIVRWSNN